MRFVNYLFYMVPFPSVSYNLGEVYRLKKTLYGLKQALMLGDDVDRIVVLKFDLASHFEMKNLGALWYFLGIEVASSTKGYLLSWSKYIVDILNQACLTNTKTIDTPLEVNV
ncbi:hypothetical protein CK203_039445 [Vitis vinifera]|uniref:Reverse transcriptase Ty1/copia-type domain-containing protein n=1 Tax=Vitis vinifera TaxID=29760 RepID=A0A438I756_VITVI|nr:hypothetical protein CK203_039445 [Vitis vinifera]